jgi:hypothetical protein
MPPRHDRANGGGLCHRSPQRPGTIEETRQEALEGSAKLLVVQHPIQPAKGLLAAIATDARPNEITAVSRLLAMLSLKGTIVTNDALNCQRPSPNRSRRRGGDYPLALKEKQPGVMPTFCSCSMIRIVRLAP